MAIGRSFEESLQKAIRMVSDGNAGFEAGCFKGVAGTELSHMVTPTPNRLYAIANEMYSKRMSLEQIHDATKIDKWFLSKLAAIVDTSDALEHAKPFVELLRDPAIEMLPERHGKVHGSGVRFSKQSDHAVASTDALDEGVDPRVGVLMRMAKRLGFSDEQIAKRWDAPMLRVRALRQALGILPCVKQIDTLGGEYPATTNYLYTTYNGDAGDDVQFDDHGVLVLGSGTYRIGSSVEFDYCSTKTVHALRAMGRKSVMLNNNPETVSTDYDENDRLYFDELSLERVLDIYEREGASGVVVSVGGQAPNNIALKLHKAGAKVLGTHPTQIDRCEDRSAYSAMLDDLGIDQACPLHLTPRGMPSLPYTPWHPLPTLHPVASPPSASISPLGSPPPQTRLPSAFAMALGTRASSARRTCSRARR